MARYVRRSRPAGRMGRDPQAGFTLVGALVSVALVGIAAVIFSGTIKDFLFVRGKSLAGQTTVGFEGAFRQYLVGRLKAYAADNASCIASPPGSCPCNPGRFAWVMGDDTIGVDGIPRWVANLSSWADYDPTPLPTDLQYLQHFAAECENYVIPGPTDSYFFFCLALDSRIDAEPPAGSVLSDNRPFALVRVNLVNISTGQPALCQSFGSDPAVGAEILYTIMRSKDASGSQVYSFTNGTTFTIPELITP